MKQICEWWVAWQRPYWYSTADCWRWFSQQDVIRKKAA